MYNNYNRNVNGNLGNGYGGYNNYNNANNYNNNGYNPYGSNPYGNNPRSAGSFGSGYNGYNGYRGGYNNGYNSNRGYAYRPPVQNGYYRSFYNMFGGYNPIADKEAAEIRRLGTLAGAAILISCGIQYIVTFILSASGLINLYLYNAEYQSGIGVFYQIFYLLVPFLIVYFMCRKDEREKILVYQKPRSLPMYTFAVFAGLMICTVANFADTFLLSAFSAFGIDFISGSEDNPMPESTVGYILMAINISVMPALLEEFAFRGVLLQPLRKHGDKFAITVTSVLFALMHGNMVQIPFAFLVGLALGYFCIITDSIWTSVTIHFLNNLSSVVFSLYYERHPDASDLPYYIYSIAVVIIGAAAMVLFFKTKNINLAKKTSEFTSSKKRALYLCSPTVVIAVIYFTFSALSLQKISNVIGVFILLAILILVSVYFFKNSIVLRSDKRISKSGGNVASLILSIVLAVVGTLLVIVTSAASLSNGSSTV